MSPFEEVRWGDKSQKGKKKRAAIGKRVESPKRKAVGNLGDKSAWVMPGKEDRKTSRCPKDTPLGSSY